MSCATQRATAGATALATLSLLTLSTPAAADVSIQNSILTASTTEISISFAGMSVQKIANLVTNEQYIAQPGFGWVDANLQQSNGESLTVGSWQIVTDAQSGAQSAQIVASDAVRTVTLSVGTDPASNEIVISFRATSTQTGLRYVFWGMQGFSPTQGKFILPAQAGIYFDGNTTPPLLQLDYPTDWEQQFVIYETSMGGALLYARDPVPNFKRVALTRQFGTLDLGLQIVSVAPWAGATETPAVEWRLKAFKGNWQTAADLYSQWANTILPTRAPDSRRDWARQIRTVVTVMNPNPAYLKPLAEKLTPEKTLLYLVNWRKSAFDIDYPDYTPGPNTQAFVEAAHAQGFRVMLHANALGVATYRPEYDSLAQYQLRDADSKNLTYWPWGVWPAGSSPPASLESFAFISPAASAFRSMYIEAVKPAITTLNPDAWHMDAGALLRNDGNGLIEGKNTTQGMVQLLQDLCTAFPQIVFSYESITEFVAPLEGFAQRWPASYPSHPISTYLMDNLVHFYGFLDQGPPDNPRFLTYIQKYEPQGIMPTIQINSLDELINTPPVENRVFQIMKLWQDKGFQPDWKGDWTGLAFRYASADGTQTASVADTGTKIQMKVSDQLIYERAQNSTTVQTPSFIANWNAWDGTTIYGLDPTQQYWLDADLKRPANALHLANLPSDVSVGTGTLEGNGYGYFELNQTPQSSFDFNGQFFSAKVGTDYMRTDHALGFGAVAQIAQTIIQGKLQSPVLLMTPPAGLIGSATFVDYTVPVPQSPKVTLNFQAGLSDFGKRSDGAFFLIRVNGVNQWYQQISLGQFVPGQVDLTQWAGQTIHLRFILHPGPKLNANDDMGCWAGLSITSGTDTTPAVFSVVLPSTSPQPIVNGALTLTSTQDPQTWSASASAPGNFVIFTAPPVAIAKGGSLLDLPFDVWQRGYGGWATPGSVGGSGVVQPIASGGVVEPKGLPTIAPQGGLTEVTWALRLPSDATQLAFRVGMQDPAPPLPPVVSYSPVTLAVRINGKSLWTQTIRINGWVDYTVDITPWQGQNVVLELDADGNGSDVLDWAEWAVLTVN